MKVCPYCHKEIPEDSKFCYHCGKEIDRKGLEKASKEQRLKKNSRQNIWSKIGLFLFFVGMIGFDFILGTVFNAIGINPKIPYYVSSILYILAIFCGIASIRTDQQDKKRGYQPTGNQKYAYVAICMSVFIGLVNLTQVIL
ncbi:hypothetical protein C815_00514 [Firmicutes bacterium M10-2]|nr:hypothetical protein C815_00514 [Firmicutes bacterium M10-2]